MYSMLGEAALTRLNLSNASAARWQTRGPIRRVAPPKYKKAAEKFPRLTQVWPFFPRNPF